MGAGMIAKSEEKLGFDGPDEGIHTQRRHIWLHHKPPLFKCGGEGEESIIVGNQ